MICESFIRVLIALWVAISPSIALATGARGRYVCSRYFERPIFKTYFRRDNINDYIDVCDRLEAAGGEILYAIPEQGVIYFRAASKIQIIGNATHDIH